MKTALQEWIEWLKAYEYELPLELQVKAKELLEKEKEQIMNAYLQGSFDDGPDSNNAEQYYNQTYHEEDDWGGLSNEELIGDDEIPKF